jgi:thiol:disulfide interchange protein DsbD
VGKPVEKGVLEVVHDKNFGVDVKYYSGKVSFVQTVKVRGGVKTNLNTTVTFMVCNDRECLPPIDTPISVKLE